MLITFSLVEKKINREGNPWGDKGVLSFIFIEVVLLYVKDDLHSCLSNEVGI
jgi:hypothetical protein